MRYRIYDNVEKKYSDRDFFLDQDWKLHIVSDNDEKIYEADPERYTVEMGTGLKDKNGVEIFEGDIISCEQYVGGNYIERHIEKGYVGSKRGSFGLVRKQGFYYSFSYLLSHDFELEVTGTIHDKEV